ncbi:UNKNOWN [Stylonychia lemnae]|uniref:Uncharacterized protein n=1 Tax=Stylonychia lemnae TaxID=5949 RepID=A0A078B6H7_STYLE|nr:UNKNOWN [Stylonychia lemnae]|eukprot:CDW89168.1 UNKNOWN [Stylonychia lemnae]
MIALNDHFQEFMVQTMETLYFSLSRQVKADICRFQEDQLMIPLTILSQFALPNFQQSDSSKVIVRINEDNDDQLAIGLEGNQNVAYLVYSISQKVFLKQQAFKNPGQDNNGNSIIKNFVLEEMAFSNDQLIILLSDMIGKFQYIIRLDSNDYYLINMIMTDSTQIFYRSFAFSASLKVMIRGGYEISSYRPCIEVKNELMILNYKSICFGSTGNQQGESSDSNSGTKISMCIFTQDNFGIISATLAAQLQIKSSQFTIGGVQFTKQNDLVGFFAGYFNNIDFKGKTYYQQNPAKSTPYVMALSDQLSCFTITQSQVSNIVGSATDLDSTQLDFQNTICQWEIEQPLNYVDSSTSNCAVLLGIYPQIQKEDIKIDQKTYPDWCTYYTKPDNLTKTYKVNEPKLEFQVEQFISKCQTDQIQYSLQALVNQIVKINHPITYKLPQILNPQANFYSLTIQVVNDTIQQNEGAQDVNQDPEKNENPPNEQEIPNQPQQDFKISVKNSVNINKNGIAKRQLQTDYDILQVKFKLNNYFMSSSSKKPIKNQFIAQKSTTLQYLWGMINSLQLILHMPIMDLSFPANAKMVFNQMISISQFDILPSEEIISTFFIFDDDLKPLNFRFEEMDIFNKQSFVFQNFNFSKIQQHEFNTKYGIYVSIYDDYHYCYCGNFVGIQFNNQYDFIAIVSFIICITFIVSPDNSISVMLFQTMIELKNKIQEAIQKIKSRSQTKLKKYESQNLQFLGKSDFSPKFDRNQPILINIPIDDEINWPKVAKINFSTPQNDKTSIIDQADFSCLHLKSFDQESINECQTNRFENDYSDVKLGQSDYQGLEEILDEIPTKARNKIEDFEDIDSFQQLKKDQKESTFANIQKKKRIAFEKIKQ